MHRASTVRVCATSSRQFLEELAAIPSPLRFIVLGEGAIMEQVNRMST